MLGPYNSYSSLRPLTRRLHVVLMPACTVARSHIHTHCILPNDKSAFPDMLTSAPTNVAAVRDSWTWIEYLHKQGAASTDSASEVAHRRLDKILEDSRSNSLQLCKIILKIMHTQGIINITISMLCQTKEKMKSLFYLF